MGGVVVQARAGLRATYQPLQSPLCTSAEPESVIAGLSRLHLFSTFYIADLDALMGRRDQHDFVRALAETHPTLEFWLDAGWPASDGPWTTVVGTESLDSKGWDELKLRTGEWILSLDFFNGHLRGPEEILAQPECWPARVIVMTLNQVGGLAGPDWERLAHIHALSPGQELIAAGGVRDEHDLARLRLMGINTALVASALHTGRLFGLQEQGDVGTK